jgi:hypothetical protein
MKKAVLTVLVALFITALAGVAFANQIDGMVSGAPGTITLPTDLVTSVNPGGLGDALIYGYYNVRNNVNIINLVNTSSVDGAKVRIVFRAAKNSRECLDFNICLSKGDTWTGYVVDGGTTAQIFDDAAFTTVTNIDADTITSPAIAKTGQLFIPTNITLNGVPYVTTGDDCKEGYIEIATLSRIPHYDKNATSTIACTTALDNVGPFTNCIRTVDQCEGYNQGVNFPQNPTAYDGGNVLMGNNDIIDLTKLVSFSYNATALADTTNTAWQLAAGSEVSVAQAMSSRVGRASVACDELDYILTKRHVMSSYDLSGLLGETEFVLTFPTRLVCHSGNAAAGIEALTSSTGITGAPDGPASLNLFDGVLFGATNFYDPTKYCTFITPSLWNHKEQQPTSTLGFSPNPQQSSFCLPFEANVIRLGQSKIWDSTVATTLDNNSFVHGWLDLDLLFNGASVVGSSGATATVHHQTNFPGTVAGINRFAEGLPAIALTTQTYINGATGYMVPMQYSTDIGATSR